MRVTQDNLEKFWLHVDKGPHLDDCWLWTGSYFRGGYGQICIGSKESGWKTAKAHRVSYFIATGIDPAYSIVCHKCDTPACVNPTHLFTGTHADNISDAVAKGRHIKGTRQHLAKLTESDVVQIRNMYDSGVVSQAALGAMFGVAETTIFSVVHNLTWRHV